MVPGQNGGGQQRPGGFRQALPCSHLVYHFVTEKKLLQNFAALVLRICAAIVDSTVKSGYENCVLRGQRRTHALCLPQLEMLW